MRSNFILFIVLSTLSLKAQTYEVADKTDIPAAFETGAIDPSGNLYIATKNGELLKYNSALNLQQDFSSIQSAAITSIQAWNPLRIFLFYESLQQYVILDRFLTLRNEGTVVNSGYSSLMTTSADNNFWLVDNDEFALNKYSGQYNKELISIPLSNILDPTNYDFTALVEYQNTVFLNDRNKGIYLFDNLGNLLDQISVSDLQHISFYKNYLYSALDSVAVQYDLKTGELTRIELPVNKIEQVFRHNNHLYIASGSTIFLLNSKKSPKLGDE